MATEGLRCPTCHAAVSPGAVFCEQCRTRLPEAGSPKTEAPTPAPAGPFELSAALPEAMQVGRRSLVMIRFRAKTDLYESVEFVLRHGDEVLARRGCGAGRPGMSPHIEALEVEPRTAGSAHVELDVIVKADSEGDVEVHTSVLSLVVDDPVSSQAAAPIVVNQTADRAGDATIHLHIDGDAQKQARVTARYQTENSAFRQLAIELRKGPGRLTLTSGDRVIQLVSDRLLTFGRHDGCTIPLRICAADGHLDPNIDSRAISRRHFRIEATNRDCRVFDGVDKPSMSGTFVNGNALPPGGSARLVPGKDTEVSIGHGRAELRLSYRLFCDTYGRPAGLVMDRRDGARQRTFAVWREIPLEDGSSMAWDGGRWLVGGRPLSLGSSVSIDGETFAVLPFRVTHIS
ncbi:MAG: FHA domain-containing protein [Kiritimatiellae bacterium]|nr:FHA domain-containing protein [Kiritimatiellia bacterium]